MTINEIAAEIRKLRIIEIDDCAVLVRAVSCKLNQQPKGFMSSGGLVVCKKEMAGGFLDQCADDLDEISGMRSDTEHFGTVEQDARAIG